MKTNAKRPPVPKTPINNDRGTGQLHGPDGTYPGGVDRGGVRGGGGYSGESDSYHSPGSNRGEEFLGFLHMGRLRLNCPRS